MGKLTFQFLESVFLLHSSDFPPVTADRGFAMPASLRASLR